MLVPPLWWSEVENGLVAGERHRRALPDRASHFLGLLRRLMIRTDDTLPWDICQSIIRLARTSQLSAYDATYLESAQRSGSALATFDERLRTAAGLLGVGLLPQRVRPT